MQLHLKSSIFFSLTLFEGVFNKFDSILLEIKFGKIAGQRKFDEDCFLFTVHHKVYISTCQINTQRKVLEHKNALHIADLVIDLLELVFQIVLWNCRKNILSKYLVLQWEQMLLPF